MGTEIERKFIVADAPEWLDECDSAEIEQGYLALEEDVEVRLRRRGESRLLTVKRGSGRSRGEEEIELAEEDFDRLWPLTAGRRISKRRYLRPAAEGRFEIDVYAGSLEGMLIVEMEFDDDHAADDFDPPEWLGEEVTGDERYANRTLAEHGRPAPWRP